MGFLDEFKRLAHPYEDEEEDEFDESFDASPRPVERRERPARSEQSYAPIDELEARRSNKVVNRRLLDFLSGVAYANEGKIKKVAISTYIITPYNVDILGDLIDELENNGLYF